MAIQPLEDGDVGVHAEVVPVDAGIGEPGQHLVVAWIREVQPVRDRHAAPFGAVAEELTIARDHAPEKWKQSLSSRDSGRPPESVAKRHRVAAHGARLAEEDRRVGTAEDFLPTKPVGYDQDDIARSRRRRGGRGGLRERVMRNRQTKGEDA
ncbi:MAG: hypothetical protein M3282_08600 [Gemmatimonadota bacterium]|nr:hypothetical protein [Gemmatimonadota bacterium]